ncbi:MAG: ABC transporter ATP-binding protein [Gammaproteobacteria bacterium]
MNAECVVRLEHVGTRFGSERVHEDISLCVPRGRIFGLVGGSGSGKTTLLREMVGLLRPSTGRVWLFGEELVRLGSGELARLHRRCGVLFQSGALFSALNVFDNIAFPLREARMLDEDLIRQLVYMKLAMVDLDPEVAARLPAELSGGMVKRVALARALALEPELLFLDEPATGLDPITTRDFVELLSELHLELGFSVVMVTHDLKVMRDLCDLIAVLDTGRLVGSGTLAELLQSPEPYVRRFLHGVSPRALTVVESGVRP